jgi:hypothetical protein
MKKDSFNVVHKMLRETIRTMIHGMLNEESEAPGGGLTDLGALFKLDPGAAQARTTSVLRSAGGDVEAAAKQLGISPRTLYWRAEKNKSIDQAISTGQEEKSDDKNSSEEPEDTKQAKKQKG